MKTIKSLFSASSKLFLATLLISSCAAKRPLGAFDAQKTPKAPNYTDLTFWAAHPDKHDPADSIPKNSNLVNNQASAEVDVFFLHPTTYTIKRGNDQWNGNLSDAALNQKTDNSPILYQASLFNGVGRVFAPRYRQAHIASYFSKDKESAAKAFEVAYTDVKAAFEYYMAHFNNGRPVIIASHSQGSTHGMRLVKEFFDGKPLSKKLVVAYLVGMPIPKNYFSSVKICDNPEETGCFCGWRTFKRGYEPLGFPLSDNIAVVNPLSMTTQKGNVPASAHKGAVLFGFAQSPASMLDAEIHSGILWVSKPKFRGSFFYRSKNYHAGDFNLFYNNVRDDAAQRVKIYKMKTEN